MVRIITIFLLINLWVNCLSQERQITVPFDQPPLLTGNAGNDLSIYQNIAYSLGNNIELQGGTPEYIYSWATPARDTILSQMFVIINSTGKFYLAVTDANNCTFVDSVTVSYATPANYPVYQVNHIFPNPVNEFLHYRIATWNAPAELTIVSTGGYMVFKKTIPVTSDIVEGDLDISDIPPGSYIFTVRTALTEYSAKIVIKR